jgi:hypothetical protein
VVKHPAEENLARSTILPSLRVNIERNAYFLSILHPFFPAFDESSRNMQVSPVRKRRFRDKSWQTLTTPRNSPYICNLTSKNPFMDTAVE